LRRVFSLSSSKEFLKKDVKAHPVDVVVVFLLPIGVSFSGAHSDDGDDDDDEKEEQNKTKVLFFPTLSSSR
tara:strand:+ start:916 stop:1128 length:213 start_codon:yes stop_codon:yes gene_type:complete